MEYHAEQSPVFGIDPRGISGLFCKDFTDENSLAAIKNLDYHT